MAKNERVDCVEMKRQAQRGLVEALADRSPAEQVEILRRIGEKSPLWKRISGAKRARSAKSVKPAVTKRKKSA